MTNITLIGDKVYEGCGWLGKIDGVPYRDLTPINPRYILTVSTYGTFCCLLVDGVCQKIKCPDNVSLGNANYALTDDECLEIVAKEFMRIAAINATKVAAPEIRRETAEERRERERKAKAYDDVNNEGGEGYNPYRAERVDYD